MFLITTHLCVLLISFILVKASRREEADGGSSFSSSRCVDDDCIVHNGIIEARLRGGSSWE